MATSPCESSRVETRVIMRYEEQDMVYQCTVGVDSAPKTSMSRSESSLAYLICPKCKIQPKHCVLPTAANLIGPILSTELNQHKSPATK